ncbi:hypothetical protein ARSEF4850_006890 [Beauveria asiatica]
MASPSHFFDPFRTPPSVIKAPNSPGKTPMLVGGLGTISAKSNAKNSIKFIVHSSDPSTQPTLTLDITGASCVLSKRDNDSVPDQEVADCKFPKGKASAYLNVASKKDPTVYWISVDRSNARFRYGQHFTNVSMTFLQKDFGNDHKWMDNLRITDIVQDGKDIPNDDIRHNDLPVTVDLPPLVVTDQQISLEALESYSHTTIANLPATCQTLYHNVAGPNITVESPTFPQLPEAIEQSLKDPNKVCGKMLAEKKKIEPWITDKELYLRITVGDNLANSPGIPYVMEIWPPGHESPIHDHGDASAVIKVLYGNIDCTWYDNLQEDVVPRPLGPAVQLTKGDVTWLGKKQFQVHKLQNNYKTEGIDAGPSSVCSFALCGMGGIGKTEMAVEYAYARQSKYDAILLVTEEGKSILSEQFARIATVLNIEDHTVSCEIVKGWLSNPVRSYDVAASAENEATWLLIIFDNADDPSVLEDFWPSTGSGSVLITSRDSVAKNQILTANKGVDVQPFSPPDAVRFLDTLTRKIPNAGQVEDAAEVADGLGGLPLLITQMAGVMARLRLSYSDCLALLDDSGIEQIGSTGMIMSTTEQVYWIF